MENRDIEAMRERHNETAMKASLLILHDAKNDMAQAMIELESVMAGVVGFYCRGGFDPAAVLQKLTENALERIREVAEE